MSSSNAERYWRSAEHPESASSAEASGPSHLAADAPSESAASEAAADASGTGEVPFAEQGDDGGAAGVADEAPMPVGSWSGQAGPSASELAAQSSDDDSDDGEGEGRPDDHDDSGWWRPSSTS
jgi:hypothetical protein